MAYVKIENGVVVQKQPYPEAGFIEAPDDVVCGMLFDGQSFTAPPPVPPSVDDVKAEANRRIIAICPEWRQRNLLAQAAILAEKGRANWTPAELTAWEAGQALWNRIAAIRAASDQIEALDPIPMDYAADERWPA